jgi:hypothetical protein
MTFTAPLETAFVVLTNIMIQMEPLMSIYFRIRTDLQIAKTIR